MKTVKVIISIIAALLVLGAIIIDQRTNLFIYAMTSNELPELLPPKDEGEAVTWFDDYYTVQKIDERTFAIGEPRYYQFNFNYLILGETRDYFRCRDRAARHSRRCGKPDGSSGDLYSVALTL